MKKNFVDPELLGWIIGTGNLVKLSNPNEYGAFGSQFESPY